MVSRRIRSNRPEVFSVEDIVVPRPRGDAPEEVPARVVIERVTPQIDAGRFPVKRVVGESLTVAADIFADGHDRLAAALRFRPLGAEQWDETAMQPVAEDRWEATFTIAALIDYEYAIEAWVDAFATWQIALAKKSEAGLAVDSELREGADLIGAVAARAQGADGEWLRRQAEIVGGRTEPAARIAAALAPDLAERIAPYPGGDPRARTAPLSVRVERPRARGGAWYEFFPRSCGEAGRHGTFADGTQRLADIAAMGFDVVYLPPIHPIGATHRKGPGNRLTATADDPGSPWAIGAPEGGHIAVHPGLGTLADFDALVAAARRHGLEVALDLAFQCSPDHPWVAAHPDWFRRRPDGTIQFAENPPKQYQDIYPLHFDTADRRALWEALRQVVRFWIARGVAIFRVDNPHTKPFAFWEWLLGEIHREFPEVIFLSEAFTRPTVMQALAKAGFSQSYTYFTWRNTKRELSEYFTELTHGEVREYLRPNLFANTPDILPAYLQYGGRAAFQVRLVLAATLSPSYGIYGPAFELCEARALPDSEEYLDSEKFQLRQWDLDRPGNIRAFITRVNQIRRDNRALQDAEPVRFCAVDNEQIIAYLRTAPQAEDFLLVVVNLDPHHVQRGAVEIPLAALALGESQPYQVHDLIGDGRYLWQGARNLVEIDPHAAPAAIFRIRRRLRTERDFDYFL